MAGAATIRDMATRLLGVALAVSIAGPALAASLDKASDGQFTGIALITDDLNWYDTMRRPQTPSFEERDRFVVGEKGALAIVFSNAEPRDGVVRIVCDVTAFDPDGSRLIVDSGPCYEGPFAGPNLLHPALLDLKFEIAPGDPTGRAGFQITLRDAHSGRSIDLEVDFTQGGSE